MFDEENLISLAIFLSFCLSVHNTYVLFSQYFFAKFSHYFFREFFALFFCGIFNIFANFRISIFAKFSLFCETDWSEILRKNRKFSYFLERMKCENIFFLRKMQNFRETIYLFHWKPYIRHTMANLYWKQIIQQYCK